MGKQVETGQHAPHTAVEVQLAAIWSTALGMEEIDVNDSFLDLGGYSLQAIRIISRVLQTFGVALALETLFGAGTIADMARLF